MPPLLAELPDSGYLVIGCIVVALVALAGIAALLRGLQALRTGLAEELKKEMASASAPASVQVQSPLVVTAHEKLVTRDIHDALAKKVEDELGRERGARKQIHQEIADLQGDVKVLKSETAGQTLQLNKLDGKIDQVLMRLPRSS